MGQKSISLGSVQWLQYFLEVSGSLDHKLISSEGKALYEENVGLNHLSVFEL